MVDKFQVVIDRLDSSQNFLLVVALHLFVLWPSILLVLPAAATSAVEPQIATDYLAINTYFHVSHRVTLNRICNWIQ